MIKRGNTSCGQYLQQNQICIQTRRLTYNGALSPAGDQEADGDGGRLGGVTTSVANERGEVLTTSESLEALEPLVTGRVGRYRRADQPSPAVL